MRKIIAVFLSLAMLSIVFAGVPMVAAKAPTQNGVLDQVWTGTQIINAPMTITNETVWVTGNITITGTGRREAKRGRREG